MSASEWTGDLRGQVAARGRLLGGGSTLWVLRCVVVDVVEDHREAVPVILNTTTGVVTGTLALADEFYRGLRDAIPSDTALDALVAQFSVTPPARPNRGFPQFDPKHVHTVYLQDVTINGPQATRTHPYLEVALAHISFWTLQPPPG